MEKNYFNPLVRRPALRNIRQEVLREVPSWILLITP